MLLGDLGSAIDLASRLRIRDDLQFGQMFRSREFCGFGLDPIPAPEPSRCRLLSVLARVLEPGI